MEYYETKCFAVFKACVDAMHDGELIRQVSAKDKEHISGFGTYGDIMIRDRKMYVVPTPFSLTEGTAGLATLILPESYVAPDDFICVGSLSRVEGDKLVVGYSFDLRTNEIKGELVDNPNAGKEHRFKAYRCLGQCEKPVTMTMLPPNMEIEMDDE